MDEQEIMQQIKKLCIEFEDLSSSDYRIRSNEITKLQDELNTDKNKHRALVCTNCGLVTRSVFTFHEHYENHAMDGCYDVC